MDQREMKRERIHYSNSEFMLLLMLHSSLHHAAYATQITWHFAKDDRNSSCFVLFHVSKFEHLQLPIPSRSRYNVKFLFAKIDVVAFTQTGERCIKHSVMHFASDSDCMLAVKSDALNTKIEYYSAKIGFECEHGFIVIFSAPLFLCKIHRFKW